MDELLHRTKILLGATYSLIEMGYLGPDIAPAFEEYLDTVLWAMETVTGEEYTRQEIIQYSFENVMEEIEDEDLSDEERFIVVNLKEAWEDRARREREARDEFYSDWSGDINNG